jgi:hypothetical protein
MKQMDAWPRLALARLKMGAPIFRSPLDLTPETLAVNLIPPSCDNGNMGKVVSLRLNSARLAWLSMVFVLAARSAARPRTPVRRRKAGDSGSCARAAHRGPGSRPVQCSGRIQRRPSARASPAMFPATTSCRSPCRTAAHHDLEFLISTDNKSLARLETFDPSQDSGAEHPCRSSPDSRQSRNAKVTVISFDDLECPYCARMHQQLFPATLDRYKDKVRFVYKDDPLVEIHPWALHAAVDANCIADQNGSAYWGYVDYLHAHGQDVTGEDRNLARRAMPFWTRLRASRARSSPWTQPNWTPACKSRMRAAVRPR